MLLVEIPKLECLQLAKVSNNLQRRDVVTLNSTVLQLRRGVVARLKHHTPPREFLPPVQSHSAFLASGRMADALFLCLRLVPEALLPVALDTTSLDALAALVAASAPQADLVLAMHNILAGLGTGWLRLGAKSLVTRAANYLASLRASATLRRASPPQACLPLRLLHVGLLLPHDELVRSRGRHTHGRVALGRRFALHAALGLRAGGLGTLPLAGRGRAHRLAPEGAVPTIDAALGFLAMGRALRSYAI
mmetsp:Transcript_54224/g.116410  ORF Transcript_54224/g.116410 Transcript_54224/m.116410 type:complete len:249 (+) Transcript_54224:456-1202(+)